MGKLKAKMPTAAELEALRKRKKEKKAAQKSGNLSRSQQKDPVDAPGGVVLLQSKDVVLAAPTSRSPPRKRQRLPSPPAPARAEKQKDPSLGLEDSHSFRTDTSRVEHTAQALMTRHDRSLLKGMTLEEVNTEAIQCSLKVIQNCQYYREAYLSLEKAYSKKAHALESLTEQLKLVEKDNKSNKIAATKATARAEQMELKLSESDQRLGEAEKELTALRLDVARIAAERDELRIRADRWPQKKKFIFNRGVQEAFLKAEAKIIKEIKAGRTDWPTPEPSEDEEEEGDSEEISSEEEDSAEPTATGKEQSYDQPPPPLQTEPHPLTTEDSFEEAMRLSPVVGDEQTGTTEATSQDADPPAD